MNLAGSLVPVDGAHGLVQHGSEADAGGILGGSGDSALGKSGKGSAQKIGTQNSQAIQQFTGSLVLADGSLCNVNDVTGIHFTHHVLGSDAGLLLAVQNSPLIGSGAAGTR